MYANGNHSESVLHVNDIKEEHLPSSTNPIPLLLGGRIHLFTHGLLDPRFNPSTGGALLPRSLKSIGQ